MKDRNHSKIETKQICESPLQCGSIATVYDVKERRHLCIKCQRILMEYLGDDEMWYRLCAA